jgi:hypothetical protein
MFINSRAPVPAMLLVLCVALLALSMSELLWLAAGGM